MTFRYFIYHWLFQNLNVPLGINSAIKYVLKDVLVTHDAVGTNTPPYHHTCWLWYPAQLYADNNLNGTFPFKSEEINKCGLVIRPDTFLRVHTFITHIPYRNIVLKLWRICPSNHFSQSEGSPLFWISCTTVTEEYLFVSLKKGSGVPNQIQTPSTLCCMLIIELCLSLSKFQSLLSLVLMEVFHGLYLCCPAW